MHRAGKSDQTGWASWVAEGGAFGVPGALSGATWTAGVACGFCDAEGAEGVMDAESARGAWLPERAASSTGPAAGAAHTPPIREKLVTREF